MALVKLTQQQRRKVNKLRERAWKVSLFEASFSQIAKNQPYWTARIISAERELRERELREPLKPADMVARLRKDGMTTRRIAAATGVHISTVYRWARGVVRPTAANMAALAGLLA
jgi:DNA-binding transcriptional regulator YiaG